ncbi:MAG TPA: multiubiquitin domain-containing protein [Candidatus Limnocylindria bacterium]
MSTEARTHLVEFTVNGKEVQTAERVLTGAAIKALGGAPADARLYQDKGGGAADREIADGEEVHIHEDEAFYTVPKHIDAGAQH